MHHPNISDRLQALSPARLQRMIRGIEKESLRVQPDGRLALTPHPAALGSALTHPHITTDFSEAQLEFVTGAHASIDTCLRELADIHRHTYAVLAAQAADPSTSERLWVSSMPCRLPAEDEIPLGRYGGSNVGLSKTVYRSGLSYRYGRKMQTISGIHYNWSLPGLGNDDYFGLIRNFRRHSFLLLLLFGASPAVCSSFVEGRDHQLEPLSGQSLYLPYATSLRMGRLGYQSDAQASLKASFNSLDSYGESLQDALTRPYPAYERIGVRDADGNYRQLATTLLQIENELYGTIRPKRVTRSGERPLHALRERGVEYVEVRLMDLDPFEPIGIGALAARVLDLFLLSCLLRDSPLDTPDEIAALARNQHAVAARGREPGLRLERDGREVALMDWAIEIIEPFDTIATALDAFYGGDAYRRAVDAIRGRLADFATLPSSRVLAVMREAFDGSHLAFINARSEAARAAMTATPLPDDTRRRFEAMTAESLDEQRRIEAADRIPFETYRQQLLAPGKLTP
ncbi:MAG: glutamate--cysteine ligase [Burkholderiaceae bacterium]